jgi:hypothetical protein
MSENVYQSINGTTVIINGGDPEKDCPKTWEEAYAIEAKMNEGKQENCEPLWDFDCGFKLDFDGPLVKVSSRFYPPKSFDSKIWDGSVQIYMGNTDLCLREFNDCLRAAEQAGLFGINEDGSMWSKTKYIYDTDNYAPAKKKI